MKDPIDLIEEHLNNKKNVIQVIQGTNKYAKNSSVNKFNWSIDDILSQASSLSDFLKQLPSKGFTSGTEIILKKPHGNSFTVEGSTTIDFKSEDTNMNPVTTPSNNNNNSNHQHAVALGYASLPQQDIVRMQVKAERYDEIKEALERTKKERDNAELDLKTQKQENASLQRKLDLIEERHEFQLMKAEKDRKGFLESETGQLFVSEGIKVLPQLGAILQGKSPVQPALGNPNSSNTEMQNLFISEIESFDDDKIDLLSKVADAIEKHPQFKEQLLITLSQ